MPAFDAVVKMQGLTHTLGGHASLDVMTRGCFLDFPADLGFGIRGQDGQSEDAPEFWASADEVCPQCG